MYETYTHKQAMAKLRLESVAALHNFQKKYPDAFIVVSKSAGNDRVTLYDKRALDKFIEIREFLNRR